MIIKFPNDDFYQDLEVDMSKFEIDIEFDDCLFGWYYGIYLEVKK